MLHLNTPFQWTRPQDSNEAFFRQGNDLFAHAHFMHRGANVVIVLTVITYSSSCVYFISHSAWYLLAFGAGIYHSLINLGDKRWTT